MDAALVVVLLLAVAALAALLVRGRIASAPATGPAPARDEQAVPRPAGDQGVLDLIRALPGMVVLTDADGAVAYASADADRLRIVRRSRLAFDEMVAVARAAYLQRAQVVREVSVRRPPLNKGLVDMRVRALPLQGREVLLLIDDLTEERRVATVRRDFIANVSHELKTPVGAISLLAEALLSTSDNPAAAAHFAQRLHAEAGRLSNLINDVIDLSRLQGEDPLSDPAPCSVDAIVAEAVEYVRSAAEAKGIDVVVGGAAGLVVMGMSDQLVTAIRNLLTNAVAYSPERTRVAVAVRRRGARVEIAVKDQGMGIELADQDRIFERFYRVDAARSRVTGGTGLGLAIVRNVCRNHGGDCYVWSVPREGSTFTMQLPVHIPPEAPSGQDQPEAAAAAGTSEGDHP